MKSAQKPPNPTKNPFYWKHYKGEIIILNVRWYCSYGLSYRDLVEMMEERVFMANPAQS
jgi:transposase-like protein